jgi:hypothetical protein
MHNSLSDGEGSDLKQLYAEELRNLQANCLTYIYFGDEVKNCDVN